MEDVLVMVVDRGANAILLASDAHSTSAQEAICLRKDEPRRGGIHRAPRTSAKGQPEEVRR